MKSEGPKTTVATIVFGIAVSVLGIISLLTYQTFINPYRAAIRGGAMVIVGIVIIGCEIYSIIQKKKDKE